MLQAAVLLWCHRFQIHPLLKHVIQTAPSSLSGCFLARFMPIVKVLLCESRSLGIDCTLLAQWERCLSGRLMGCLFTTHCEGSIQMLIQSQNIWQLRYLYFSETNMSLCFSCLIRSLFIYLSLRSLHKYWRTHIMLHKLVSCLVSLSWNLCQTRMGKWICGISFNLLCGSLHSYLVLQLI